MRRLTALLLLAACVRDQGVVAPPECTTSGECDLGEECRGGICFGNPPNLDFAVALIPPENRPDLAATEMESLGIAQNGETSLVFATPAEVTGRVLLAAGDAESVGARVFFRRPSAIPGLGTTTVEVRAQPGKVAGEASFRATLTRNRPGEHYDVTVLPDDGTLYPSDGPAPSALAPPLHMQLELDGDVELTLALRDASGLKAASGHVLDAASRGMKGMTVLAWGRRGWGSPSVLASSVGITDDYGAFTIYVPVSWEDEFDVVVSPGPGVRAPTLRRGSVSIQDGTTTNDLLLRYPSYPRAVSYELPVLGPDDAGGTKPSDGATVTFRTTIPSSGGDEVTYQTQGTADTAGYAEVWLLPGGIDDNRIYHVDVVPLPNARHASVWDQEVSVGPPHPTTGQGGVLTELTLARRAYLTGTVINVHGIPVENATVRPVLSPVFTNTSPPELRARADAIGLPQNVTTDRNGLFALYLDAEIAGAQVGYDLELVPPLGSRLPRWSTDGVVPATAGDEALNLGNLGLPDASLAFGVVRDAGGDPVADAEVRVYVRSTNPAVCLDAVIPGCVPPARLRALARSDSDGNVVLVLPKP